jgi:H+/Na+-translocating ferredoxin:NAD+ oxidoreductase subunit B
MKDKNSDNKVSRRKFLTNALRVSAGVAMGGIVVYASRNSGSEDLVWQLDPEKCIQCGQCVTNCVLTPSAVKCVHVYDMCGYCDLCGGYFRPDAKQLTTGAENQLCPTGAIERKFVEDPFFEYKIAEDLCIGCGKCVAGCGAFGNGSLQLQVRHDICTNCNQCNIALKCPADAFSRVPVSSNTIFNGFSDIEFVNKS